MTRIFTKAEISDVINQCSAPDKLLLALSDGGHRL